MDYNEIKKLITDIGESKVDEVNLEFPDGIKISVKKNNQIIKEIIKQNPNEILENKEQTIETKQTTTNENYKIVKSPMVGTFYSKSSPTAESFVKIGSKVKKGDTLCIIEAMKLMNEIESEFDGEVVDILVHDEEAVDYGKELFIIK